jgi:hypothetical protein
MLSESRLKFRSVVGCSGKSRLFAFWLRLLVAFSLCTLSTQFRCSEGYPTAPWKKVSQRSAQLRAGLLEALKRRAAFTRSHRGKVSGRFTGSEEESSAFAVGWHTEFGTSFVWHQDQDHVMLAKFNQKGASMLEPHVIGSGRWPRIVGDGDRVAVGWVSTDGKNFVVRVNDGKQWGNGVQLAGSSEAALAFAPGGPLYAATSTGLWKLNGDHFDRFQEGSYSQPTISVDKDGKPHVASRQNGHVVYDGNDLGEGERPSIIFAGDGTANLAYISKGALVMRSAKGGQWSAPDTIPAKNPSWPTLALDDKGAVRLSYIGPADFGPDATWLVRLPDKQAIMMPSLAGNVTDVWFTTKFDLRQARNYFRRHDLLLTVNDVWVKMFENTVPEGRYLFRLNPYQVFTSSGAPVPNRVAIHSWHMNGGHYASNSDYQLIVRTAWSEHYVFAANEQEARKRVTSERVNHDQPDLGVYANAADLPVEMPKPGPIDIPILIANLGEASSAPTRLVMRVSESSKEELGSAAVPPLKAGEEKTITMRLQYNGKEPNLWFGLENNNDFDPSNDTLNLVLWDTLPTGYVGPEPNLPKVPVELKLTIGGQPASEYEIVDPFSERIIAKVLNGEQFGPLRTGAYRVAIKPYPLEGQEVLFDQRIEHQAGTVQEIELKSGITLEPADVAAKLVRWSAARADDPANTVQSQGGAHPFMALPAGDYQVTIQPSQYEGQGVVWPERVHVGPDAPVSLRLDSAVHLEVPQQLAQLRWSLVQAGKPEQVVQWQNGTQGSLLIPPGDYQVMTEQSIYEGQPVVWPQKMHVAPGQQLSVKLDSTVHLEVPQEVAQLRWHLVQPGKPKQVVQWQNGTQGSLLIPPGDYQVMTEQSLYEGQPIVWPQKIGAKSGQRTAVKLDSGIRIVHGTSSGGLLYRVVDNKGATIQTATQLTALLIPPGMYMVDVRPGPSADWKRIADHVQVNAGSFTEVKIPDIAAK